MIKPDMETRDADLGYAKRYIEDIHDWLSEGNILTDENVNKIRQAYELLQSAWIKSHLF